MLAGKYQPDGYALFDNISVTQVTGNDVERYYYYENGLLARKENVFYAEYYEYDEERNLTRVANNRGELTDYVYTASDEIDYTVDYDYTWEGAKVYPYNQENPNLLIEKTAKTKTDYTYNSYGLLTAVETYPINVSLEQVPGSLTIYNYYSYNTTSDSRIFGTLYWEQDSLGTDIYYYYDETDGKLLATVNSDEDTGVCYSYDAMGKLTGVMPATYVGISRPWSKLYSWSLGYLLV